MASLCKRLPANSTTFLRPGESIQGRRSGHVIFACSDGTGVPRHAPSGKRLEFAIEHDHRNSEFSHENWWILA